MRDNAKENEAAELKIRWRKALRARHEAERRVRHLEFELADAQQARSARRREADEVYEAYSALLRAAETTAPQDFEAEGT